METATLTPDLSVLIVNFNGKGMLRDLLTSLDATRGDLRVQTIVFDNASSDGSAQMVETEFPDVILKANDRNVGFALGNNAAARLAHGEFLLLLNNDTVVRPGALAGLVEFMRQRSDVVAAGPQLIGGDGKPQRSGRNLPTVAAALNSIQFLKWTGAFKAAYRRYRAEGFDPEKPGPIGQLAAAALVLRRARFEKCGGFDEGFEFGVEDVDLCDRLGKLGLIYYLPSVQIEHLGRISSRANRGFVYRGYECGWARYLGKHHGRGAALLYKSLVTADMPVRLVVLTLQWTMHRLSGQREKAARMRDLLMAAGQFTLVGLPRFWRS